LLQKIEGSTHLADTSVVASHVVVGHSLSELIVFAQFLRLLEQVQRTVYVLLLEVVNGKNVADFAELLATA